MKFIRTAWLVFASIAFAPILLLFEVIWLGVCIYASKLLSQTVKDGVKAWWRVIKAGIEMNKDFVNNGIFGY